MITWLLIFAFVAGLIAAGYVYFRIVLPMKDLKESLRRLASHDFRPVLLRSHSGVFQESSGYINRISDLLQHFDRQVTDEGFSLRAILSSMAEGVLITDRSQRVRLANEALSRMFDLGPSLINRSVIEVFRNLDLQNAVAQVLDSGATRKVEITLSSGKHLDVYAGGLNPKQGIRPLGAVVVFHDVTTIKNLESIRREFVANISHEFRTPLTIINGYIETLLDGALDDRQMSEKSLRVMHKNGQRLTMLIEDLLTISRMETRSAHLDLHPVKLCDLLSHVLERLESSVKQRGAQVIVSCPAHGMEVEVDPQRIEQVFSNLLENALRYGSIDNPRVEITVEQRGEEVEVAFADNGPGIPFADQPHIFERFYRVHKDRSRSAGGTGLGLSIVRHVIQAHGGSVALQSVPGQGATFRIRLPIHQTPRRK